MKRSRIADFSLLLVAMMWGCTFLIVQNAVKVLPPLAFNSIRFMGAALLLALITVIFYRKDWKQLSFRMVRDSLLLGLFLFMGYGFQTMGLLYTTTSNTGFITGLSVVLVPFLSLALLKHAISRYTWFSAALAAIGLYLLTFTGSALSLNKGDALILLCAIAFALQVAYTGVYAPHYPALPLATLQLAFVGLFSIAASLIFEGVTPLAHSGELIKDPDVLWALLISIGPTSAFAFWIQTACQKYTTPSRVAIIYATEPVFAVLTGLAFGGETLGLSALLGCGCILGAMLMAELSPEPGQNQHKKSYFSKLHLFRKR
ncbi:EamA family transporter [Paenibacillus odorifer]|uniref:DMT family transporter n=1 Tax=Paenibacillus odorifer TaxID=189426 RepID=UPI00096FE161|nr:DMT family transporter [Paenibacillus odorifer]OMD70514.1 EamA family transporter [Paenibacillus odorifer]